MGTLHDDYLALNLATLDRWKDEAKQESLHLDFKRWGKPFNAGVFAQAASAFANAEGGIIVWGVDCRKDKQGVDAVGDLFPVENVDAALTTLKDHSSQVLSPGVPGIDHRVFHKDANGAGLIATFVPPSDAAPHMAGFGDRYYFKRNSTSSLRMEHYEIADMFGKRQRPDLVVTMDFKRDADSDGDRHRYLLKANLTNRGRAMARFLKVVVTMPAEVMGWPSIAGTQPNRFEYARTTLPLFPDETCELSANNAQYHMDWELTERFENRGWPSVTAQVFQESAPSKTFEFPFKALQKFA